MGGETFCCVRITQSYCGETTHLTEEVVIENTAWLFLQKYLFHVRKDETETESTLVLNFSLQYNINRYDICSI